MTLQIALTFALLAGAALLIQTMNSLAKVLPGYDTENILTMTVTCMRGDRFNEFHQAALERVSALPGVKHAAFVWGLPLTGNKWGGEMEIVGQPGSSSLKDKMDLPLRSVTPDYFDALGVKLVDGRGFRASDSSDAPRVAMVNQALAERYFPKTDPLGKKLRFVGNTNQTIEVVGIVSNTRTEALSQSAEPEIYFPFWQSGAFSKHLIVRTASRPAAPAARRSGGKSPVTSTPPRRWSTSRPWRKSGVNHSPREPSPCVCWAGFPWWPAFSPWSAFTGCFRCRSVRAPRKSPCAWRSVAQRHEILRLVLREGFRLIVIGLAVGVIAAVSLGQVLATFLFRW